MLPRSATLWVDIAFRNVGENACNDVILNAKREGSSDFLLEKGEASPSLQPRLLSANAVYHARLRTGTSIFLKKMNLCVGASATYSSGLQTPARNAWAYRV